MIAAMTGADWVEMAKILVSLFIAVMTIMQARTSGQIHTLVNSQYGESLRVGMVSARALFVAEPTADNKRLAEEAALKYADHVQKQAVVDSGK